MIELKAVLTDLLMDENNVPIDFVNDGELVMFATLIVSTPSMPRRFVSLTKGATAGPWGGADRLLVMVWGPGGRPGLSLGAGLGHTLLAESLARSASHWK